MLRTFMNWLRGRSPQTTPIEDFREAVLEPEDDFILEAVRKRVKEIKRLTEENFQPQHDPPYDGVERRRNWRRE